MKAATVPDITTCNSLNSEAMMTGLHTSRVGLTDKEALERRMLYGPNLLPEQQKITIWQVILHQFTSPLIYVLMLAALVALLVKEFTDAGFIALVLIINAILGGSQEWKAESDAAALKNLMKIKARVRRNDQLVELDASDLVPGDVVYLESGNKVPADIRLLETTELTVEEALLTGESLPVRKTCDNEPLGHLSVGERLNMAHAGTTVMNGRGMGIVTSIGLQTELGKIAGSLSSMQATKVPLVQRMEHFSRRISLVVLVACIILGIIGLMNGIPAFELFFFMIAIAVSAIPEGLPIAMTVALSIATMRMARRNVIVRRLTAVEGLGSCTFIATDKTGTLTVDEQTARKIVLANGNTYTITGEGYDGEGVIEPKEKNTDPELVQFIEQVTICNEGTLVKRDGDWHYQGDAIDVALLALSYKMGTSPDEVYSKVQVLKKIPFESHLKYAAVYYSYKGRTCLAVKGAIEMLLQFTPDKDYTGIVAKAEEQAAKGYRIIGVGIADVEEIKEATLPEITLLGFVALIDPIRPDAREAIEKCHMAGVNVAMVTGDHPATALSIAQELKIAHDVSAVITGNALGEPADATDAEFMEKVKDKHVFARVSPFQKQKIVEALQHQGHFVAVTGDGVNDAPALKAAHIGVAMGYGTDVAKDTSSIIITDNNFASIAAGIEEGRYAYSNIRKIIYLLISTGAAELMIIAMALVSRLPLPFVAVQLIWLNLVTNGIQDIGLAFEKGEKGVMKLPPRHPSEGFFNKLMIQETLISGLFISSLSFAFWYYLLEFEHMPEPDARNRVLLLMVLLQNFHVLNCRSETRSIFHIPFRHNIVLITGIVIAQGVHILAMHVPFMQDLLTIKPVRPSEWLTQLAGASLVLVVMEIYKWVIRRKSQTLKHV